MKHTMVWNRIWRKVARAGAMLMACVLAMGMMSIPAQAEEIDLSELYKNKDVDPTWVGTVVENIDLNALTDSVLTLSQEGDYRLTGTLNGQIVIDAPEEAKVHLILAGVEITSPQGPAIYEKQADKLIVTLEAGTVNTLTDGAVLTEGDDSIGAALYAEDDLSINGDGTLTAHGTAKHGIQSKADLIIAGGSITVDAVKDAIRGRNSVLVLEGTLNVTAGGDGIVSTREDKEGKGWVIIAGGTLSITTGNGAGTAVKTASQGGRGGWGKNTVTTTASASSESQKGIKAATTLTVMGGTLNLDCADDGLHAADVTVSGGNLTIKTGDDGIHADSETVITDGTIDIIQCYEGIEGKNVTISGGDINVVASDDGVNAAGGNDGSGFGGRGGDKFSGGSGSNMLTINGGSLRVQAGGDGLDSNGSIAITGGFIGLWCATTMGEGAIDLNGSGTITGGTLIIASTGGVMSDTAAMTGQAAMAMSVGSQAAGTEIALKDGQGNVIATYTPGMAYDTVVVSSDKISEGSGCLVACGGQNVYNGVMASNLTTSGMGGGFGSFGGGRGNKRGR